MNKDQHLIETKLKGFLEQSKTLSLLGFIANADATVGYTKPEHKVESFQKELKAHTARMEKLISEHERLFP